MPKAILILTIFLAFLLRFYNLSTNPPGLNLDEVAIGYNAYSILKTGKDEYGTFLPITFRSHDDYKPPLYIYLTVPSIGVFGLNEFAVRFPSALLGVFAVGIVYFLVKELFPRKQKLALLAAFLLAISPWHLQFTRAAFETGSTVFFTSLGVLLFLKKRFVLSALIFGLELYLYQAAKVFVPLLVVFMLAICMRKLTTRIVVFCTICLLLFLPIAYLSTTTAGQIRFQGTSIFQKTEPHVVNTSRKIANWLRNDRIPAEVFHPEPLEYTSEIVSGYLSHFRPDFLFLGKNGPPANFVPEVGLLYLWELPFLIAGLYFIYKRRDKRPALLLTLWFLLAPIPAAVTAQVPSSIRTTIMLPTLQIFVALGILSFKRLRLVLIPIVIFSIAFLTHMQLVHAPLEFSKAWYYGYKEVVEETNNMSKNYDEVIVSTRLDQPQNFYAFYLQYDPKTYLEIDGGTISGGFREDKNHFAKFSFKPIDFPEMSKSPKSILFVGKEEEFPVGTVPLKKFAYLNGATSVIIVGEK